MQKELAGGTRAFRRHAQLEWFRGHPLLDSVIAAYLNAVRDKGDRSDAG
jgi:hypothetical protein